MSRSIIGTQRIVSENSGRNVDDRAVVGSELTAAANHVDHFVAKLGIAGASQARLRSRIDPGLRGIASRQSEGTNSDPMRSQKLLDWAGRKSILIQRIGNRERLPAIDVS